jgi:hypothetical protein
METICTQLEMVTPSSNNAVQEENPKVPLLSESDPWGLDDDDLHVGGVCGIALRYLIFRAIGNTPKRISNKRWPHRNPVGVRSEACLP